MAKVMTLVWRLDFLPSYAFMDKLGTVRRILQETIPNYWTRTVDGNIVYSFIANHHNTDLSITRDISVEMQSVNGRFIWKMGTELLAVLQTDEFRNLDRLVKELLRAMEIRSMTRVGIRFQGLGSFSDSKRSGFTRFTSIIGKQFVPEIEKSVRGANNDLSFIFVGNTEDALGYRIACGPCSENDFISFYQQAGTEKDLELLKEYDFTYDIDLSETNTSFVEHNLFPWARTKLERALDIVAVLEKLGN